MAIDYSGGCLCGAVRYTVTGEIKDVSHCHCSMCRKAHGAAFATYASVSSQSFSGYSSHLVIQSVSFVPFAVRRCSGAILLLSLASHRFRLAAWTRRSSRWLIGISMLAPRQLGTIYAIIYRNLTSAEVRGGDSDKSLKQISHRGVGHVLALR
jgi:Glutathione-dependent formaldehyde-activating enzyme